MLKSAEEKLELQPGLKVRGSGGGLSAPPALSSGEWVVD